MYFSNMGMKTRLAWQFRRKDGLNRAFFSQGIDFLKFKIDEVLKRERQKFKPHRRKCGERLLDFQYIEDFSSGIQKTQILTKKRGKFNDRKELLLVKTFPKGKKKINQKVGEGRQFLHIQLTKNQHPESIKIDRLQMNKKTIQQERKWQKI